MEINLASKYQVLEIVEKERLIGVMNTTKWNALFNVLNEIDELVSFRCTYIDGSTWPDEEASFPFTSELAQVWGNFIALEFIDIDARISHSSGALLNPKIIDHKQKVIDICQSTNAKFSLIDNGVRIYGYFRQGNEPNLYSHT